MKKFFTTVLFFIVVMVANSPMAQAARPITDLLKEKYEIKSSMIPPMGGAIIYVLQKKDLAYMCVQDLKGGGKTMCDQIE